MANQGAGAAGGAAGGAGRPPRRGYHVPDMRIAMGLMQRKDVLRNNEPGSGNPNLVQNMNQEQLQALFFEYLLSNGVPQEELETNFPLPRWIGDQGVVGNEFNQRARGNYQDWAGLRREFFYLQLLSLKSSSAQMAEINGNIEAIGDAIDIIVEDLDYIFKQMTAIGRVAFETPDQLMKNMEIPKPEKAKKPEKGKKRRK